MMQYKVAFKNLIFGILIFHALITPMIYSRLCDSYFECSEDKDCWDGSPGFRCGIGIYKKTGKKEKICVCGGVDGSIITTPDGIARKYHCTTIGPNGARACLIKPNWPCWPTESLVTNYINNIGWTKNNKSIERIRLEGRRSLSCGNGFCNSEGICVAWATNEKFSK